jgi:YHS domain-containing protein
MKSLILLTAAAFAAAPAMAAKSKESAKPKTEVKCAVMKDHSVKISEATGKKAYADYKGNRYFFCCAGCKPDFEKNPAKYAKADHIPTPKGK